MAITPPTPDKFGQVQLCWGATPEDIEKYVADNNIGDLPLEIAVGVMMIAVKGKANPQIVYETLQKYGCS